jgi:hypothetical protein
MQQIIVIAIVIAAAAYMGVRAIRHFRGKNKCGCGTCPLTNNLKAGDRGEGRIG